MVCSQSSHQPKNHHSKFFAWLAQRPGGQQGLIGCGHVVEARRWLVWASTTLNESDFLVESSKVRVEEPGLRGEGFGRLISDRYYFPTLTQAQMPLYPTRAAKSTCAERMRSDESTPLSLLGPGPHSCILATNGDPAYQPNSLSAVDGAPGLNGATSLIEGAAGYTTHKRLCSCIPRPILTLSELRAQAFIQVCGGSALVGGSY